MSTAPKYCLIFGPPGAGKGTHAPKICELLKLKHVSTGDMLREAGKNGTELGMQAKEKMDAGDLVDDALVIGIVEETMKSSENGFLFDGFPRTIPQAKALDAMLLKNNEKIDCIISLDVDYKLLEERILARGREDDTAEAFKERMNKFDNQTKPILAHYQGKVQILQAGVNGTREEAWTNVETAVNSYSTIPTKKKFMEENCGLCGFTSENSFF